MLALFLSTKESPLDLVDVWRRFFVGLAAKALGRRMVMDWMPTLIGDSGCGKSLLAKTLALNDRWHRAVPSRNLDSKENKHALVVEVPDLSKESPINRRRLKSSLTNSAGYGFVVIGTSEPFSGGSIPADLKDGEGSRRFVAIDVDDGLGTQWVKMFGGQVLQLVLEGRALLDKGWLPTLPDTQDFRKAQHAWNARFAGVTEDPLAAVGWAFLVRLAQDNGGWLTMADILESQGLEKRHQGKLGPALEERGWTKTKVKGTHRWHGQVADEEKTQ